MASAPGDGYCDHGGDDQRNLIRSICARIAEQIVRRRDQQDETGDRYDRLENREWLILPGLGHAHSVLQSRRRPASGLRQCGRGKRLIAILLARSP
jgi:hypothetical protein